MKNRVRRSAVLFLSMMLTVALLAGFSPASSAAPVQLGMFDMDRAVPAIADKAGELGAVDAAQQAGEEEVPLKDRLLKDEMLKEADTAEAAAPAEAESADAALPEMLTEVELFPEAAEAAEAVEVPAGPAAPETPVAPEAPAAPRVSLEALRRANDPEALIAKYGGFGYDQIVYADIVEDSDLTCYVTDSTVYYETPEVSFDWADYDWSSFDWDLIEDWDDWAEFGSPDWDGYDRMDGFGEYDYMPQMAVLSIGQNSYQMDRYKDGTTVFAASWLASPDGASSAPAAEEPPRRLLFDSPLLELTDVRTANGLLAVTMQESPFAFEETDPFFSDDGWTFDDEILDAADSWAFRTDWAFGGADRGCNGCCCTCDGCGCGCRDGAAANAGPMNAEPVNAGVRWVCYLDPATLEVQYVEAEEVSPDGSILPLYSQTVFYTEPESGLYHDLLNKAAAYEAQIFVDPRTVTVVYDPGTERETVVSAACEKGDFLTTTFMEGYLLYEDAKGTVPFVGNFDPNKDLTIYAIFDDGSDSAWYAPDAAPVDDGGFDARPADALPDDALPPEVGGDAEAEGPFEAGPAAIPSEEPDSVLIVETEAEEPGVVIVEPDADQPGVVVLNPAEDAEAEEDASQEAVILPEEEEKLDYAEVSDRVYEANKLDAIFGNHASVQYCLTFDKDLNPDIPCYIYETPDMAYSENRDAAFYADRAGFYQMWTDGTWSDLYYTFDFINGFDPHLNAGFELVPDSPEQWWNPQEETPLDAWAEGGSVYLKSVYSEAMSRAFVETWLPGAYTGQTVTVLAVADQETYELTSLVYTLFDQDGQVVGTPLIYSIDYDLDEPRACRNLRACAKRSSDLTAELTIIRNPGTDEEGIETMTVPAGSTVIYVSDAGMSLYEDAGCTVPASRWDKLSDMTWYLAPDMLPEAM